MNGHLTIHKISIIIINLVLLLIVGLYLYKYDYLNYSIVDKETANNYIVDAPDFSVTSGFYNEEFYIDIHCSEKLQVYYTLDSSEPTISSNRYSGPILIKDATLEKNNYSMRTDVSAGFYSSLIDSYKTLDPNPNYVAPDYLVDKCTILRAIAVDSIGNTSKITTGVYFVGNYDYNCRVISIVTDPSNLFDYNTGIYVTGYYFDKYMQNNTINQNWRFWDANYRQRGKEWERACETFIFENKELLVSQELGIRIQGNVSRGTIPRSLNLFARKKYGSDYFKYQIFEDNYYPSKITLSCGGNKVITKINDKLMSDLTSEMNYATARYEPCVLFLDGEYWGFYWIAESFTSDFFSLHYNVNPDNVLMIKNDEVEIGETSEKRIYNQMRREIIARDMRDEDNYKYACSIIDMDSVIDYYATMAYIARGDDWPNGNYAMWRSIVNENSEYGDCKWRMILFDCNSLSMNPNVLYNNSLDYILKNDSFFASLWDNNEFKKSFEQKIIFIADNVLESEIVNNYISKYNISYYDYLKDSWTRFHGINNTIDDQYKKELGGLKDFYTIRRSVVEEWFY